MISPLQKFAVNTFQCSFLSHSLHVVKQFLKLSKQVAKQVLVLFLVVVKFFRLSVKQRDYFFSMILQALT